MNDYYVYVYIDPRNYEEFYYGKGKGTRKFSHLIANDDSEKSKRIEEIRSVNLNPIIKVIAAGLSESQALLIESTLIWKLGKYTTNIAAGYFSDKFRAHNTFHLDLPKFDYQNGLFYYNVGEGDHRNWDDYVKFGFISAGQGKRWRDSISGFNQGDIFVAYLKGHGYVGIGKIIERAKPVEEVYIGNNKLLSLNLKCKNMSDNSNDYEKSEYVCTVNWIEITNRDNAKWKSNRNLYTTTHIRASLENQKETIEFLEKEFKIKFVDFCK